MNQSNSILLQDFESQKPTSVLQLPFYGETTSVKLDVQPLLLQNATKDGPKPRDEMNDE